MQAGPGKGCGMPLFLALLAVPIIEIALFIQVGGLIGLWPTLAIVLLTAMLGSQLIRAAGLGAFLALRSSISDMRDPTGPLFDGAMILLSGALLLTPGFLTDSIGLLLLIPRPARGALPAPPPAHHPAQLRRPAATAAGRRRDRGRIPAGRSRRLAPSPLRPRGRTDKTRRDPEPEEPTMAETQSRRRAADADAAADAACSASSSATCRFENVIASKPVAGEVTPDVQVQVEPRRPQARPQENQYEVISQVQGHLEEQGRRGRAVPARARIWRDFPDRPACPRNRCTRSC